jgi:uroporphyrinogen-III synthase
MNKILITRPEPQAELTALALTEAGFDVLLAPAIQLRALPDAATQVHALRFWIATGWSVTYLFMSRVRCFMIWP